MVDTAQDRRIRERNKRRKREKEAAEQGLKKEKEREKDRGKKKDVAFVSGPGGKPTFHGPGAEAERGFSAEDFGMAIGELTPEQFEKVKRIKSTEEGLGTEQPPAQPPAQEQPTGEGGRPWWESKEGWKQFLYGETQARDPETGELQPVQMGTLPLGLPGGDLPAGIGLAKKGLDLAQAPGKIKTAAAIAAESSGKFTKMYKALSNLKLRDLKMKHALGVGIIGRATQFVSAIPEKQIGDIDADLQQIRETLTCLLYTSPSPRDATLSRMPSSA